MTARASTPVRRMTVAIAGHRWALLLVFCGVLLPLCVFGLLAEGVWEREGFMWDTLLLRLAHGYATPTVDRFMIDVSTLGGARGMVPLIVLALITLLLRSRHKEALFMALAYGGAVLLNALAKALFHSPQPHLWISPAPEQGYGFPSGHAMSSLAALAALSILAWPTRWRWPALILGGLVVILVGVSRVYLGVHYPSDVVAAWAAALAWVVGVHLIMSRRGVRPRTPSAHSPA